MLYKASEHLENLMGYLFKLVKSTYIAGVDRVKHINTSNILYKLYIFSTSYYNIIIHKNSNIYGKWRVALIL